MNWRQRERIHLMKQNLNDKDLLNPSETIAHFGLSSRKFYALIRSGKKLDFIAFYGGRRLVIRSIFEKYLAEHTELRRCWKWETKGK